MLNQALGLLDHHFCNLDVAGSRLVKGRSDNFALHQTLHLGNFFRAFVNQQNHQHAVWMVVSDALCNVLQQHGFTGFRRSNNQTTLTTANRRGQIQHASRQVFG
ncbi:hypothetical protein D3C78_1536960 [compost metagenome]